MAATDAVDREVVDKDESAFDLLIRLGALMGAATALLTALQTVLDMLQRQEIVALLPAAIGFGVILALVAAISGLTHLARRSRSAVIGFLATISLAAVTTVLGMAMAAAALPRFGYQLALQRVAPPDIAQAPLDVTLSVPAGEAPTDSVAPPPAASEIAPPPPPLTEAPSPSASDPTGSVRAAVADPFEQCVQAATASSQTYEAKEEAIAKCLSE